MPLDRKYYLVSGLPRSGSTLLMNILAQNPQFNVTATSGILQVLVQVRNTWDAIMEMRVAGRHNLEMATEQAKRRVLASILKAYFDDSERPVCFDKSRGWLAFLEMAQVILGDKPKVIVPVRDLRDVHASFERLWRQRASTGLTSQEQQNPALFRTVENRIRFLAQADQIIGSAQVNIQDAVHRGWKDQMHFVVYDDLVKAPMKTMNEIYDFLGEERYKHDFEHVEQVTYEDDFLWGWTQELHKIKPKIEPQGKRRNDVIPSKLCNLIQTPRFWDEAEREMKESSGS